MVWEYTRKYWGTEDYDPAVLEEEYKWFKSSTQCCDDCGMISTDVFGYEPVKCKYCNSNNTFVIKKEI